MLKMNFLFKSLFISLLFFSVLSFVSTSLVMGAQTVEELQNLTQEAVKFDKNTNIWFMLMLVAFLMAFIRKFEWSICLGVILVAASSFVSYVAIQQFYLARPATEVWSQDVLIAGVTCAITVVIAIGVIIGTIPTWQYIIIGFLFSPAYALLEYGFFTWIPAHYGTVTDPGGGILVHMFAAYWGLGAAMLLREKRAFDEPMHTTKHSITFAWLAAMILFIFWPSFVTALMSMEETSLVMANCYMSGFGSMLSAYLTCKVISKRINPLVFMYAMLAGPIASSSSLLLADPWGCFILGLIGGTVSSLGFIYVGPFLNRILGIVDVMGVHQLHGLAGWVSLIGGVYFVGNNINFIAGLMTVALGLLAGFITAIPLRLFRGKMDKILDDENDFEGYNPDPVHELQK